MDIRKLQRAIVDGLEDVKAQDILVFNTEHLSALFERVIIASGTSNRQTKALASGVRSAVRAAGFPVLATEGGENGEWIIVDCGAAVVHVMQPAIREYYRLEEIWGGKPVRMKIGSDAPRGLVKASEPEEEEPTVKRKPAAKKVPVKRAPAKRAPAKKVAAKIAPVKLVSARKLPAKKAVAKQDVVKTTGAGRAGGNAARAAAAVAKLPAKKAPARKAVVPASKTIVVKPFVRKTATATTAKSPSRDKATPAARKTAPRKPARA
ncbi:MAG: ribosome silencing factor [Betaproteobacteria bacterium]|nr:ribosome silencing factor [Betaproteobacteria bacterium]